MIVRLRITVLKQMSSDQNPDQADSERDRRRFLELCSKFAVAMPPAVSLLLYSSDSLATHNPEDCQGQQPPPCPHS
jgi:hypothetical protein